MIIRKGEKVLTHDGRVLTVDVVGQSYIMTVLKTWVHMDDIIRSYSFHFTEKTATMLAEIEHPEAFI